METIFDIVRRKEEQLKVLQEEIEKLRAAAEIIAREQGIAFKNPAADIESQLAAAVAAPRSSSVAPSTPVTLKKIMP